MAARDNVEPPDYKEYTLEEPDRVARYMRYGIVFLIISILCILLYALLTGVFAPSAPRTLVENALAQAQGAVDSSPGSGKAWAALAGAYYASGDEAAAWDALDQARKSVKDRTILHVNNRELEFLLLEGREEELLKRVDKYIEVEAKYQMEDKAENLAKGITVPDVLLDNADAVKLFVFKGTAQGNLGQWDEAIKTFDTVLELDDRAADIITLRGWAKLRSGDRVGAKQDFERALQFLPDNASAQEGLAEASGEATSTK